MQPIAIFKTLLKMNKNLTNWT